MWSHMLELHDPQSNMKNTTKTNGHSDAVWQASKTSLYITRHCERFTFSTAATVTHIPVQKQQWMLGDCMRRAACLRL